MKPFNLQEALAGKPVITRDGRPVKIAGYNEAAFDSNALIGWVNGAVCYWYKDGTWCKDESRSADLFMAPTERKEWVVRVVNPTDYNDSYIAGPFLTYNHAKDVYNARTEGWATIHEITITE